MPFLILALALLATILGMLSGLDVVQKQNVPAAPTDDTAARAWLAYKAGLLAYVEHNPAASGAIPLAAIQPPAPYTSRLSQAGNDVVRANGTTAIESWMPLSSTETAVAIQLAQGDLSIGSAHGDRWSTPSLGDMGTLPIGVPEGNAVSVVILSGADYR